jgi:hypothetical protein
MSTFHFIPARFDGADLPRYVLVHEHKPRSASGVSPDPILFTSNFPVTSTADTFRELFSPFGAISSVSIFSLDSGSLPTVPKVVPGSQLVAHVCFEDPAALKKVLTHTSPLVASTDSSRSGIYPLLAFLAEEPRGFQQLMPQIEAAMAVYDRRAAAEKRAALSAKENVDEDGWTTVGAPVSRSSRQRTVGNGRGLTMGVSLRSQEALMKMKREAEARNVKDSMYAFQRRQRRLQEVAELRKQHAAVKKRIGSGTKASRKFKAF